MKFEKMGMRTIKTGIAVMLCLLVGQYLVQNLFYSAIACVISIQDTVKGSMKAGLNRVKGTILGGIVGFLIALIKPGDPILCGLGIMITIYICNTLDINSSITVSCVTFLAIQLGVGGSDPALYSVHRVIDTSVGVVFGVVINYLLIRPNYLENTINEFKKIERMSNDLIKSKILNKENLNIEKFSKEIEKLEKIYSKLIDELKYSRGRIDTDKLDKTMNICREIYFHLQSIELLEKKLYLNDENYTSLKSLYKSEEIDWDVDEDQSPVFNYHLSKVIEEVKELHNLNGSK